MQLKIHSILEWFTDRGIAVQSKILQESGSLERVQYLTSTTDVSDKRTIYVVPDASAGDGAVIVYDNGVLYLKDMTPEAVFDEIHTIFQHYQRIEDHIITAALSDDPIQSLADVACTVFGAPVLIEGVNGGAFASSAWPDHLETSSFLTRENMIDCDQQSGAADHMDLCCGAKGCTLMCTIRYMGCQIGKIWVYRCPHPLNESIVWLMGTFQNALESSILLQPETYFKVLYIEQELIPFLNGEGGDIVRLQDAFRTFGWEGQSRYQIAVISGFFQRQEMGTFAARMRVQKNSLYYILEESQIVLLCNLMIHPDFIRDLTQALSSQNHLHGGYSYDFQDLQQIGEMYRQACYSLKSAAQSSLSVCGAEETTFSAIASYLEKDRTLRLLVDPDLDLLWKYDQQHKTEYFRTLRTFLLSGYNYQIAADRLGTHTNTLRYRIRKIEELIAGNIFDFSYGIRLLSSFLVCGESQIPHGST